ncbi:translocon-associated protein subunit beta isoform X1 [Eucalyptus grandis]|uniref:translocon-associated protein subunit beta isoform X1 n=1 Tax=Eucalyptus grandis TaxID=71139 RepID=UPI00192EFB07|nr:translocon-associated protein subunit beta isoform X1 [Eucalyptus grandis]
MANPIPRSAVFAAVLALLLLAPPSLAATDVPFIVAHKKASLKRLKSGAERVLVSIDIYNQGSSIAYDVSLSDDSWSQEVFDVVSGNTSQSWERLDSGGLLSHSFELEAKEKGMFFGAPAVIKFRIPTKAPLQVRNHNSADAALLPLSLSLSAQMRFPPSNRKSLLVFSWPTLLLYCLSISLQRDLPRRNLSGLRDCWPNMDL